MFKDWKSGISTPVYDEKALRKYHDLCFETIEISAAPDEYPTLDFKKIVNEAENIGIGVNSVHLPYYPFEIYDASSKNAEIRKKAVELQSEYAKRAGDAGIKIAVIHPSGEPIPEEDRKDCLKYSVESMSEMADICYSSGITIAIEDLPRSCIGHDTGEIKYILSTNEKLRVCFDTNHLLKTDNIEFVKEIGDKIITLHVSDYDFVDEKHWLPGEGKNDWNGIIKALENVGYGGAFLYELNMGKPRNLEREPLTYEDVMQNYGKLLYNTK